MSVLGLSVVLRFEAVDEAGFDGGFYEFGGVFYLEFLHQVEAVVLYCSLAEEEGIGYVGIGESFYDVFQDFLFSPGEGGYATWLAGLHGDYPELVS